MYHTTPESNYLEPYGPLSFQGLSVYVLERDENYRHMYGLAIIVMSSQMDLHEILISLDLLSRRGWHMYLPKRTCPESKNTTPTH